MANPRRIFIVEDEYLIAATLEDIVADLGHICIGPVATLPAAMALAETEMFDCALVNMVLDGKPADPLCELLEGKGIPFAFATGLDEAGEGRWRDRPKIFKPYTADDIRRLIEALLSA